MPPPPRSLFGLTLALAIGLSAPARAEPTAELSIATNGTCPSSEQVQAELHQLLPEARLEPNADSAHGDIVVTDRGDGFTVQVRGQRRRFREPKRDCTERARNVAVFTVLVVDPLRIGTPIPPANPEPEPEPEPEPQPEQPHPQPKTPTEPHPTLDLALGPVAQIALVSDAESTTPAGGIGVRLRYGRRAALTLGVAGLLPTSLHFQEADARATWLPLDVGLALADRWGAWELELDLSATAALLLVQGQALDVSEREERLELGGRLGGQVRYWASERAGLFGSVSGTWFPKPYTLQVDGMGRVGETPTLWIGGSLGAVVRL